MSALTSVIRDIQGGLEGLPGGSEVRRRLLVTSLDKLQSVSSKFLSQASIDQNRLIALIGMGDVFLKFGTGENRSENGS